MWRYSHYHPDTGGRENHSLSEVCSFILLPSLIPQRWKVIITRLWQQQPLSAASSCSQLTAVEVMKPRSRLSTRSFARETGASADWPSWPRGGAEHLRWPRCRGRLVCVGFNEGTGAPSPWSTLPGRAVTFWWRKILKIHTVSSALWQLARSLAFK